MIRGLDFGRSACNDARGSILMRGRAPYAGKQTFMIHAVLADGRGVWLRSTCPTCDHDLREGGIVCSKCARRRPS